MKALSLDMVNEFISEQLDLLEQLQLVELNSIELYNLLELNYPFFLKVKPTHSAANFVCYMLDATLSSSEEKMFGDFLESLAIFISAQTSGGRKSSATGIDLEFEQDGIIYLVSIKSGPNWGNSSQKQALRNNFLTAKKVLQQGTNARIQPVLGICYGKSRTTDNGVYQQIMGQNFWYFISGNKNLYTEIIEPVGYRAKYHNEDFDGKRSALENRLAKEFIDQFCNDSGTIQWDKLVQFNSGNLIE